MTRHPWHREDLEFLRASYADTPATIIAKVLGRTLRSVYEQAKAQGLKRSRESIAALAGHISRTHPRIRPTAFKPGAAPWNKGRQYQPGGRSAETRFKPGRPPEQARNYQPIGSLRIDVKDGYLERKVSDDPELVPARRWVAVHRLVWEAEHGPIPHGHVVAFRAGMKTNVEADITVDRLELITRGQLAQRNSIHRWTTELKAAIKAVAKLRRAIAQHEERAP